MSDKILKLSQAQTLYQDLRERIAALPTDSDIPEVPVQDVQVNGTSVLNQGVANIPAGSTSDFGVFKLNQYGGLQIGSDGLLKTASASEANIQAATDTTKPIVPARQHVSVFYGLSKVAGVDLTNETVTLGTYPETSKTAIRSLIGAVAASDIPSVPVQDVQVNGTSVLNNGVANIPVTSTSNLGVVKINTSAGIQATSDGTLSINRATDDQIKAGTNGNRPLAPGIQHIATFYGLAKAAGDSTQSSSSNTVGIYTDDAKQKIQNMLGITDLISTEESSTATAAHAINSTFMMDGKLHRATATIAIGDAVVVGTNCEIVKVDEVFTKNTDLMVLPGTGIGSLRIKDFSSSIKTYSATASGTASVAFGAGCIASGNATMAVGNATTASGGFSFAAGYHTIASGAHSMALGNETEASGGHSSAIGFLTSATGDDSFVFGTYNVKDNWDSWPEWTANTTYAVGDKVKRTTVSNNTTTVQGYTCITANSDTSFTTRKWYEGRMNYIQIVGNGITTRSNAYALDWEGNGHYGGYIYVGCNADSTGGTRLPHDIQINGTSIINNGVASIPVASSDTLGVVKIGAGLTILNDRIIINPASIASCKAQTSSNSPITPMYEYAATFYGLATAAGDSTQSSSDNTIGNYTTNAKTAIQTMLGAQAAIEVIRL